MNSRPYLLHALSPLHAGTGQAVDIIDLPIARMRATGIPFVPGSSIKGVLRDARMPSKENIEQRDKWLSVFGPETNNASEHAGAIVVGDARLLAMPVRSFKGTFAWVTSPFLLNLARRDFGEKAPKAITSLATPSARVLKDSNNLYHDKKDDKLKVFMEDLDLPAQEGEEAKEWAALLQKQVFRDDPSFSKRFVLVDDETMTFLWETATQIDMRTRIDENTRTVAKGALWSEESLPPESLLIGVLVAQQSAKVKMSPSEVSSYALPKEDVLQFGGKATVGRGRCRILSLTE